MKMKTFLVFSLVLMSCCLCKGEIYESDSVKAPYVDSGEETADTQKPMNETEVDEKIQTVHSDIWAELIELKDMVVEQNFQLRHLQTRVTAAESLVEALQNENTAQTTDIAVTQQKLSTLQQRVTNSERRVKELETQQEGQKATLRELQDTNRVRKLAFSASLLASGEGNTGSKDFVSLIYRNVFTNIGNHYNSHTGHFTAPVQGVYYFRFTGHVAHTVIGTRLRIVKNGQSMVFTGDRPTMFKDPEDSLSNGVVLQLQVGDVVSVQLSGDVWDDQYHRTTFSGFLLFPL